MSDWRPKPLGKADKLNISTKPLKRILQPASLYPSLADPSIDLSQAYPLDGVDFFFFNVWNSKASVALRMYYKYLSTNGDLITSFFDTVNPLPTDRSQTSNFSVLPPKKGWLISASIVAQPGITLGARGQTYCQVGLIQAKSTSEIPKILFADYIHTGYASAWPGGTIRSSIEGLGRIYNPTPTDPAAGAELVVSVPTNARWRIYQIQTVLTTSGTTANRTVGSVLDDGTNYLWKFAKQFPNQTASLAVNYEWSPDYPIVADTATLVDGAQTHGFYPSFTLSAGFRFTTNTAGLLLADQYSGTQMLVEEWIET